MTSTEVMHVELSSLPLTVTVSVTLHDKAKPDSVFTLSSGVALVSSSKTAPGQSDDHR